jgi:hypothetical protein
MSTLNVAAVVTTDVGPDRRLRWRVFGVLTACALVGLLAVLPYALELSPLPTELPIPKWLVLVTGAVQNLLLFGGATGLGLWLGDKVGLGAPLLRGWLAGDAQTARRVRASLPLVIGGGSALGALILLLERLFFAPRLPAALQAVDQPGPWQGFLASFYGGINEELLTRLGLMTLLVWIGVKLSRRNAPGLWVMWGANLVAALLFGAGHLPALAALTALTPFLVLRTMLLNGMAGVLFGWIYWQRGLLAVMVAHFSADIVLHVVGAALA